MQCSEAHLESYYDFRIKITDLRLTCLRKGRKAWVVGIWKQKQTLGTASQPLFPSNALPGECQQGMNSHLPTDPRDGNPDDIGPGKDLSVELCSPCGLTSAALFHTTLGSTLARFILNAIVQDYAIQITSSDWHLAQ